MELITYHLISFTFHSISFIAFGLVMEVIFTAISDKLLRSSDPSTKICRGYVSIYMIPIYGLLLPVLYEPAYLLFNAVGIPWYIRFVLWAILISGAEALTGWLYYKYLKIKPWDYSRCKDKVFRGGYTRWFYVPLWGIVGLILEPYSQFLMKLSPYVYQILK